MQVNHICHQTPTLKCGFWTRGARASVGGQQGLNVPARFAANTFHAYDWPVWEHHRSNEKRGNKPLPLCGSVFLLDGTIIFLTCIVVITCAFCCVFRHSVSVGWARGAGASAEGRVARVAGALRGPGQRGHSGAVAGRRPAASRVRSYTIPSLANLQSHL